MEKKLFIEELEVRQSSSPLFVSPIDSGNVYTTMALGEEGGYGVTLALFESGEIITTFALGEEGGYIK